MRTLGWKLAWLVLGLLSLYLLTCRWHLEFLTLPRHDPVARIRQFIADHQYVLASDEARYWLEIAEGEEATHLNALLAQIEQHRASMDYQAEKIVSEGLLTGVSDEVSGQIAGGISSLMLIGDLRDLVRQGMNYLQDEPTDRMLITLTALSLVASVAQGVSIGTSSPVKAGLVVLAQAHKRGALPLWLQRQFFLTAEQAWATRSLSPLVPHLDRVSTLISATGWEQGLTLLGRSRDPGDLNRLALLARHLGRDTGPLVRLGGETALTLAPALKQVAVLPLKQASRFGPEGLRMVVHHGVKRFLSLGMLLVKLAMRFPWLIIVALLLLKVPVVIWWAGLVLSFVSGLVWLFATRVVKT